MICTNQTQPLNIEESVSVFIALYVRGSFLTMLTLSPVMVIVDLIPIFGFVFSAVSLFAFHLTPKRYRKARKRYR